jgi:hypothetical protein
MKFNSVLASVALLGLVTVWDAPLKAVTPQLVQASAQQIKIAEGETAQQKIDRLTAIKGKPGSGDLMRKLYEKALSPIGIQPGGAGMVVNTTISYCANFDVIVAIKQGKIAKFPAAEVK